jgi:outer membrane protein
LTERGKKVIKAQQNDIGEIRVILKRFRILLVISLLFTLAMAPFPEAAIPADPPAGAAAASPPTISLMDAIFQTIRANPQVSIAQETVVQGEGLLQQAAGAFDTFATSQVSSERMRLPFDQYDERQAAAARVPLPDYIQTETNAYSVGLSKLTRSGVSVAPSLSATDFYDNTSGKVAQNASFVNFNINVPLLRNLGREATGAEELSRESALKAARLTTRHNISQLINITAANYWTSLANQMSFELTMDTQRRAQKLLDLVEKLVKAGSLEPAALNQARANLLSNRVDVRGQQERVYISRQALAVSMGLTPQELPAAPSPGGDFPAVVSADRLDYADIRAYISAALRQRGDYLGAQADIETATILLRQAQNQLKPRLDLGLNVGYAGLSEETNAGRYFQSLGSKPRGLNYLLTLNLELPIQNNAARGNMVFRKSQARVFELALKGLANQIASEALVAYEGLRAAVNEYQMAEQAEAAYGKAVEFENQKYMSGGSTLTAVIDVEGRYFNARTTRIEVLRKYASALANFRFVTGSLLDEREGLERFDLSRLLVFPVPGEKK